jgi:hypothetical protein
MNNECENEASIELATKQDIDDAPDFFEWPTWDDEIVDGEKESELSIAPVQQPGPGTPDRSREMERVLTFEAANKFVTEKGAKSVGVLVDILAHDRELSRKFVVYAGDLHFIEQVSSTEQKLIALNGDTLAGYLSTRIEFVRHSRTAKGDVYQRGIECPRALAYQICKTLPSSLRRISRVVHVPQIDADGNIRADVGIYEGKDGDYLVDTGLAEMPPEMSVEDAKAVLADIFGPDFMEAGNMAPAIAAMMTPHVRGTLLDYDAAAPMLVISAREKNSGKSLGARITTSTVSERHRAIWASFPQGEPAVGMQLTSTLRRNPVFLVMDDVNGAIESSKLCAALTSPTFCDREVRTSRDVEVDTRTQFILTSNGAKLLGDLDERSMILHLRGKSMRAPGKPFLRPGQEAVDYAEANRLRTMGALFSLVRAWIAAGRPKPSFNYLRSPAWGATVAAVLEHAGYEIRSALEASRDSSEDKHEVVALIGALIDQARNEVRQRVISDEEKKAILNKPDFFTERAFSMDEVGEKAIALGYSDKAPDKAAYVARDIMKQAKWLQPVDVDGKKYRLDKVSGRHAAVYIRRVVRDDEVA